MKKILSLLLCYVFLQAETFALRGGPNQTSGGGALIGLYAGVFIPDVLNPLNDLTKVGSDLGLFQIQVPQTGPSKGTLVIFDFQAGDTFLGLVNGVADPDSQTLTGIFKAVARLSEGLDINGIRFDFIASLSGTMSLKSGRPTQKNSFTQRIIGTGISNISTTTQGIVAGVDFVAWTFDGWQQTASPTVAPVIFDVGATLDPPAQGNGTGGTGGT